MGSFVTSTSVSSGGSITAGAGSNRLLIIAVRANLFAGGTNSVSGVTVGAVNAQHIATIEGTPASGDRIHVEFWGVLEADIPSGANAVTATWASGTPSARCVCMTLQDCAQSLTPYDTLALESDSVDTLSGDIDARNGDVVVGCLSFTNSGGDPGAITPTALTERHDASNSSQRAMEGTLESSGDTHTVGGTTGAARNAAFLAISLGATASAPAWSVEPSITDTSAEGNTASFTPDSSATAYMGVYKKGSDTPSAANLKAGAGTGFIAVFSKAVTGADTLTSTGLDFPVHDYFFILSNANGDSSIALLTNVPKNPATGQQYRTFETPLDGDTVYSGFSDPAIADGDIQDLPSLTANGNTITPAADGNDVIDSPDETRDYYDYRIYDVSAGDWMQFVGHPVEGDGDYGRVWWNNETPVATELAPATLLQDVAMSPITLASFITDDDDSLEDLTLEVSPDSVDPLPTGVSISTEDVTVGESTLTVASLEGTPTAAEESGVTTLRITDITGAYIETAWEWSVVATSTVPDVDDEGTTEAAAIAAIEAENLVDQVFGGYSATVPVGEVISQDPAAGTVVAEGSVVTITVSLGISGSVLQTTFLDDETAVPASARMVAGSAFAQDGSRYVAAWPANNEVVYRGPFAHRPDGALLIASESSVVKPIGVALTERGEVIAAVDAPDHVHNGWPLTDDGTACMTEIG